MWERIKERGLRKRENHGNVIKTLLNLSKAFLFSQPQSATWSAVSKKKKRKLQANYNIRWNAPMQATRVHEREGTRGQLRDFTQCGIFIFYKHFAFFWSRPDPTTYAYVNNEMSIIFGRMKHCFLWPPSRSIKLLITAGKGALPANAWLSLIQHCICRMIMAIPLGACRREDSE